MGLFERYLSICVALSIGAGVFLGNAFPSIFSMVATLSVANVNVVIALLIWLMILPMMVQVDFSSIKQIGKKPKGLILTLIVNWLIKPFSMAFIGWLFFNVIFDEFVDSQTGDEYIAGMILLGVAPCTAMVFVWSQLTKGDANYTLVQVAANDVIMIFAFAPIAGGLLGMANVTVPWVTLIFSVLLYVVLPLIVGAIIRKKLQAQNAEALTTFLSKIKPFSVIGLLATVLVLFGLQAQTILEKPMAIVLIAIPLLIQTYGIFAVSYTSELYCGKAFSLTA